MTGVATGFYLIDSGTGLKPVPPEGATNFLGYIDPGNPSTFPQNLKE